MIQTFVVFFEVLSFPGEPSRVHSNVILLLLQKISSANCCLTSLCIKRGKRKQPHLMLQGF